MKVIFLDVDGVLNSEKHAKELYELVKKGKMSEKRFAEIWDLPYDGTVLPLKKIIDETGAVVVLSSSWRMGAIGPSPAPQRLTKVLDKYGIKIIDKTCVDVYLSDVEKMGFDIDKCYTIFTNRMGRKCTSDRGAEIAFWLHEHPEVESFVILDDDVADIDQYYEKQHVWTNFYDWGLTFELAEEAIKVLNGQHYSNTK